MAKTSTKGAYGLSLPPPYTFIQFLEDVMVIGEDDGYHVRPAGMYGYEKTYWRDLYNQGLTAHQAWNHNQPTKL